MSNIIYIRRIKVHMKSRYIATVLVFLMIVQILGGPFTSSAQATAPEVRISSYTVSKSSISAGQDFDLSLSVENVTANPLEKVFVVIDDGSFSPKGTGAILDVGDIAPNSRATTGVKAFTYDGGSARLSVTIKYSRGGSDYQQSDYINVTQAVQKDTTVTPPVDTTKYAPKLEITSNAQIPEGNAGTTITYKLPVKNTGLYPARNIVVSPVFEDGGVIVPSSMNASFSIETLQPNETKELEFTFNIAPSIQQKVYSIKFNLQYYNYSLDSFTSTVNGMLKITADNNIPKLSLKSTSTDPAQIEPGDSFKLNLVFDNNGSFSARDVNITLNGLKSDGISLNGTAGKLSKDIIPSSKQHTFTYDLNASQKIEAGATSLRVKVEYRDAKNNTYSDDIEFYVVVANVSNKGNLVIKDVVSPDFAMVPGKDFVISMNLNNTGLSKINNVKVSIAADKEIIPKSLNTVVIHSIDKGGLVPVEFSLGISDDAASRNYPIAINIEYESGAADSKQTAAQYVGVYVEGENGKSVPRIIIDKYNFSTDVVKAGEEFTLTLSLLNTSTSSDIKNVKVTVSSDDGTFTPANSSNSFYISSLSSSSKYEKQLSFISKADAAPKQYMLSINYEYEDDKGTAFNSKDTIGVPLNQLQRLVLGELAIPTEIYVGNPLPVGIEFFNMGKTTLYNLMVKLEGSFRSENGSYFVGNFESGKSDNFDGTIIPEAAGEISGKLIFSFEDENGKKTEMEKEIALTVMEPPIMDEGMPPPDEQLPEDQTKISILVWVAIAVGVVVVATIVFVIIRRRIKKRKELTFDE